MSEGGGGKHHRRDVPALSEGPGPGVGGAETKPGVQIIGRFHLENHSSDGDYENIGGIEESSLRPSDTDSDWVSSDSRWVANLSLVGTLVRSSEST